MLIHITIELDDEAAAVVGDRIARCLGADYATTPEGEAVQVPAPQPATDLDVILALIGDAPVSLECLGDTVAWPPDRLAFVVATALKGGLVLQVSPGWYVRARRS